jgi:DNA-binding IclR family transcriptional regulator
MTQTARVLSAVKRGGQDARTIAKMARVPLAHVHPLLNRLRARGQVKGYTGSLKAKGEA